MRRTTKLELHQLSVDAARAVLHQHNIGQLVNAVEVGRRVYDKVVAYVRYQMTQLLSLVMLFVAASAFDVNDGVALTPLMVLYLLFFATASGVVIIAIDPGDPDVMHRPPRDPQRTPLAVAPDPFSRQQDSENVTKCHWMSHLES